MKIIPWSPRPRHVTQTGRGPTHACALLVSRAIGVRACAGLFRITGTHGCAADRAARLELAGGRAAVARIRISIIALLAALEDGVPAHRTNDELALTGPIAFLPEVAIAVVLALLATGHVHGPVPARKADLDLAGRRAAIAWVGATVITALATRPVHDAVAAHQGRLIRAELGTAVA